MSEIVKVTIRDQVRYVEALQADFMPTVRRGLYAGALRCMPILQRATREARPANPAGVGNGGAVNTGGYLRRWRAIATADGSAVYNDHVAAAIIELGRRAGKGIGKVGMANLVAWVRRRLGVPALDANSVAFVVARAIRQRGLLPRHVMGGAQQEMATAVLAEVMDTLDARLRQR